MFGLVVLVAAWRIDRLENLGINPWSVPGLLPGLVGGLIILLALTLAWQARPAPMPEEAAAALALCVLFAGVSIGRGLPFMLEGAVFIFLFTAVFSWSQWRAENRVLKGLATTLAIALVASLFISWLFESVFLVRLP